jgi:hypothetical protein
MKRPRGKISVAGNTFHSKHSYILPYGDSKLERNIIVNYDSLLDFCTANMNCRSCRLALDRDSFHLELAGVACDITYLCLGCREKANKNDRGPPNGWILESAKWHGTKRDKIVNEAGCQSRMSLLAPYDINVKTAPAIQYLGSGELGVNCLMGILGVSHNAYYRWTELEEAIALEQIRLGKLVLAENLEKEKEGMRYSNNNNSTKIRLS